MALPPPTYTTPNGSPSLEGWADTFTPTLSAGPDIGAPTIGPVLPESNADDTFGIGGSFADTITFETYSQTTGGNALQTSATIRRIVANRAVLSLSASIPASSMVLLYGIAAGAYSTPVVINRAETWWLQSHTTGSTNVLTDDTVSIYGRNLSNDLVYPYDTSSPSTKCMIWLYTASASAQMATCTAINPYRAQFTMPALWQTTTSGTTHTFGTGLKTFTVAAALGYVAGLAVTIWRSTGYMAGTVTSYSGTSLEVDVTSVENGASGTAASWTIEPRYSVEVYTHNGHGGAYGWSRALTLNVTNRPQLGINYDKITAINVAAPNGTDDTTEINNKIASVGNDGPASIVLQSGTYKVNSRILVAGGFGKALQLKGQGSGSTTVIPTAGWADASNEIIASNTNSELRDLTVDTTSISAAATVRMSRIIDCVLRYKYPSDLQGNAGLASVMTGSTTEGPRLYLENVSSAFVDGNDFHGKNATTGLGEQLVLTWGGKNICLTNNTAQHYDDNGTDDDKTHGRIYWADCAFFGRQMNVYIAGNTTPTRLQNPQSNFGDGELFAWEGALCSSSSMATAATTTTVTITDTPSAGWTNTRLAAVVGGLGEGQMRPITNVNVGTKTLTVDPPWDLTPDATSLINVVATVYRAVIYGNSITGGNILSDGSTQGDSQGWQTFAGGAEIIVDANTFTDMNYGYSEWSISTVAALTEIVPLFFNLVQNNTFVHCNYAVRTVIDSALGATATGLGNVRRNNSFTQTVVGGWYLPFGFTAAYFDADVWQDCLISGEQYGLLSSNSQTVNSVIIDTSWVGDGLSTSVAKPNTTIVFDQGSTSYTLFGEQAETSYSGVLATNTAFHRKQITISY